MTLGGAIFHYFTAKKVDPLCVGSAQARSFKHSITLLGLAEAGLSGCRAASKGWRVGSMGRKWVQPRCGMPDPGWFPR